MAVADMRGHFSRVSSALFFLALASVAGTIGETEVNSPHLQRVSILLLAPCTLTSFPCVTYRPNLPQLRSRMKRVSL